jgi:hypothetical protein
MVIVGSAVGRRNIRPGRCADLFTMAVTLLFQTLVFELLNSLKMRRGRARALPFSHPRLARLSKDPFSPRAPFRTAVFYWVFI